MKPPVGLQRVCKSQGQSESSARSRKRDSASGGSFKENGYAKIEGGKVWRMMQSVCLTLGRDTMATLGAKRKAPETADDDENPEDLLREKRRDKIFMGVGQHSSISKRHVQLVYDFTKRRWAIICLGRNGVFVDDVFVNQVPARERV